jgi:hypothetical protein
MSNFEVAIDGRMNKDAATDVAWQLVNHGGFDRVIVNFLTPFGLYGSVEVYR